MVCFAGIGVGIKNDGGNFNLGEKDKTYEIGYYSVYGTVDVSFLKISGGYIFNSRERYDDADLQSKSETERSAGNEYFVSLRLVYQF